MRKLAIFTTLFAILAVILTGCAPATSGAPADSGFQWSTIIFMVVIFGIFYFLMIRPQKKRQKEHAKMIKEIQKGDEVMTAGGIFGIVDSVNEDNFVIKIESGATMKVIRSSVVSRENPNK